MSGPKWAVSVQKIEKISMTSPAIKTLGMGKWDKESLEKILGERLGNVADKVGKVADKLTLDRVTLRITDLNSEKPGGVSKDMSLYMAGTGISYGGNIRPDTSPLVFRTAADVSFSDFEGAIRFSTINIGPLNASYLTFHGVEVDQAWYQGDSIDISSSFGTTMGLNASAEYGIGKFDDLGGYYESEGGTPTIEQNGVEQVCLPDEAIHDEPVCFPEDELDTHLDDIFGSQPDQFESQSDQIYTLECRYDRIDTASPHQFQFINDFEAGVNELRDLNLDSHDTSIHESIGDGELSDLSLDHSPLDGGVQEQAEDVEDHGP